MGNTTRPTGILLAAGQSKRFGSHKGLALLSDGTPMALRCALNLRAATNDIVCVLRPGDSELHDLLKQHDFKITVAANAAQGMSASLQAGILATREASGWLIALADMPLIAPQTYQALTTAFSTQQQIIVPCLANKQHNQPLQQGHPVIFPARYKSALLALHGDKGAKTILQQYKDQIQRVYVDDPGILRDFDTPEAFKHAFSRPQAGRN